MEREKKAAYCIWFFTLISPDIEGQSWERWAVKEVSIQSAREKNIRHGHISTLHIWWARRPLASSRTTGYAALIPAPDDIEEWNRTSEFIIELSKWENSLNPALIEKAREDILKANGGVPPRVLDPFGGGGAIPLEALRLGCGRKDHEADVSGEKIRAADDCCCAASSEEKGEDVSRCDRGGCACVCGGGGMAGGEAGAADA